MKKIDFPAVPSELEHLYFIGIAAIEEEGDNHPFLITPFSKNPYLISFMLHELIKDRKDIKNIMIDTVKKDEYRNDTTLVLLQHIDEEENVTISPDYYSPKDYKNSDYKTLNDYLAFDGSVIYEMEVLMIDKEVPKFPIEYKFAVNEFSKSEDFEIYQKELDDIINDDSDNKFSIENNENINVEAKNNEDSEKLILSIVDTPLIRKYINILKQLENKKGLLITVQPENMKPMSFDSVNMHFILSYIYFIYYVSNKRGDNLNELRIVLNFRYESPLGIGAEKPNFLSTILFTINSHLIFTKSEIEEFFTINPKTMKKEKKKDNEIFVNMNKMLDLLKVKETL